MNDKKFDNHFKKTQNHAFESVTDHKRKQKNELDHIKPRKQHQKCEFDKSFPNSIFLKITFIDQIDWNADTQKKRSKLSEDDFSKNQTMQCSKIVSETHNLIFEKFEKELEASKNKNKEKNDFINYWVTNHIWFDNFAESRAMFFSNNINKRQRSSNRFKSGKNEKSRSYFQSRKNENDSKQYIKSYEKYIFIKNLNINDFKNEKFVSSDNKVNCKDLQNITCQIIFFTVYFKIETLKMIKFCRNRNEAMIYRNVTSLIVSSIKLFYLKNEVNQFEHFIDEINKQWYENWVLTKFRSKSDLIVDFFSSAFTTAENEKLINYTFFENLIRSIDDLSGTYLTFGWTIGNKRVCAS